MVTPLRTYGVALEAYAIAPRVQEWGRAGRAVVLIRAVTMTGTSAKWPNQVLAPIVGEGPVRSFLNGAVDGQSTQLGLQFLSREVRDQRWTCTLAPRRQQSRASSALDSCARAAASGR